MVGLAPFLKPAQRNQSRLYKIHGTPEARSSLNDAGETVAWRQLRNRPNGNSHCHQLPGRNGWAMDCCVWRFLHRKPSCWNKLCPLRSCVIPIAARARSPMKAVETPNGSHLFCRRPVSTRKAIDAGPAWPVLRKLGLALVGSGSQPAAIKEFDEAVRSDPLMPRHAPIWAWLCCRTATEARH